MPTSGLSVDGPYPAPNVVVHVNVLLFHSAPDILILLLRGRLFCSQCEDATLQAAFEDGLCIDREAKKTFETFLKKCHKVKGGIDHFRLEIELLRRCITQGFSTYNSIKPFPSVK